MENIGIPDKREEEIKRLWGMGRGQGEYTIKLLWC